MCNIDVVTGVAKQYRATSRTDIPAASERKMKTRKKAYKILIEMDTDEYVPWFQELPVMRIGTTYEMSDKVHGFYAEENRKDAEKLFERECDIYDEEGGDENLVLAEVMLYNILVEGFNVNISTHAIKTLMAKKQKIVKIIKRRYE